MEQFEKESVLFQSHQRSLKLKTSEVIVTAGDSFLLPILINKPNTILQWIFHTQDYDIDFGVTGREVDLNDPTQDHSKVDEDGFEPDIVEVQRCPANVPQQGQIVIPQTGMYYILWDNSYSWIREKHIVYSVELVFPEPTVEEARSLGVKIVEEIEKHNQLSDNYNNESNTLKQSISTLENDIQEKQDLIKKLQEEISVFEVEKNEKTVSYNSIINKKKQEDDILHNCYVLSPFYLEGNRIFSYLSGDDLVRLHCVNQLFKKSVQQDYIWHDVFERESKDQLALLLRNNWILQKWHLFKPDQQPPVYDYYAHQEQKKKEKEEKKEDIHVESIIEPVKEEGVVEEKKEEEEAVVVEEKKEEEEAVVEEKKEETTIVEEKKEEETVEEKKEEIIVEEPKKEEEAIVEEKKEEAIVEEPKKEETETVAVEEPKKEEAIEEEKKEETTIEEPKKEETTIEEPKKETTIEEPKKETTIEEPKKEEATIEEPLKDNNNKQEDNLVSTSHQERLGSESEIVMHIETVPGETHDSTTTTSVDTSNIPTVEDNKDTETQQLSNLTELQLLYSIKSNQGWYINTQEQCYYIYFSDPATQKFEVWTGPVSLALLDQLYTKTKHSSVLIACPGTTQGQSGYYIDRHRKVTQWTVSNQGWSEVIHN
ncbi:hypothetical protein WA158_008313 [Blastocystis sp. Blastoise]